MPRIDPLQLLKCLSVLLSPEGGILSRDEVPRLVNLMTKFSKKLVSKCVYVLILKNTETSLVDMFMAEGGWTLIQSWLQDAAQSGNWDLVKEILGLLLITPVDVERLKMNCLPKLIKNLSRREDLDGVAQLSNQIVQNWLVIVKGSAHNTALVPTSIQSQLEKRKLDTDTPAEKEGTKLQNVNITESLNETQSKVSEDDTIDNNEAINTNTFYKASSKESKHTAAGSKVSSDDDKSTADINSVEEELKSNEHKDSNEKDSKLIEKDKERTTKPSSSSKSRSVSSSSRDKEKDKDKKRSSHSSSSKSKSSSSSSSSSSRDKDKRSKDKDRDKKDKDRHRHSSSSKSSSSKSSSRDKKESKEKGNTNDLKDSKVIKDYKEKQAEKDKDTLQKIKPHTLDKLGRIPKKSSSLTSDEKQKENKTENKSKDNAEKDLTKKPSFSILNRKTSGEERSKTVKVFNSKMRSTGLEEEVKPPPPRSAKKPTPSLQLPTIPQKRPSPPREPSSMPPEKKIKVDKVDVPDRPGSIKLIPPKPKPPVLQESDMFMDALTASAPKKEAKKRKRRLSVTKDAPLSPSSSPAGGDPPTPTSPTPATQTTTSLGLKNLAPINFYQDTLSDEPEKNDTNTNIDNNDENQGNNENITNSPDNDTPASPVVLNDVEPLLGEELEPSPPKNIKVDGLKGVLLYTKKKGPKRSIKWKCEDDLVEIRYFELDETERVNVTKTFGDLAKMDISSEREALIMSRKTPNEDLMEPQIMWRMLYVCEQPDHLAPPGSKSLEKDIQFAREKTALPALYYDKRRIPDSPEEPIPENHQMSDPVIIPLEDPESQEIDLRSTPWPEPKGPPPQVEPQPLPPMFQNIPFNPNFNNLGVLPPSSQFVGVPPRFPGPGTPLGPMSAGPGAFVTPNMMHNNMMGPPINQTDMMNQGPINPVMFGPGPDGFIGPGNDPNFQLQQFNGPQGPNINMYGQNNFHHRGGEGDGRGGYRRGGGNNGGWVRMNGPRNNWKRGRGGNSRGGRLCKNIQNHGYCRNGDNCPFIH